jgi:hypothetical protein
VRKKAENNVNYQNRAREFRIGDVVVPYGLWNSQSGRITAVYPAIGMADVEFPIGNKRVPVEVLMIQSDPDVAPPFTNSAVAKTASARRVVALYWADKDRKYRATRSECEQKSVSCPRCPDSHMRKTTFTRAEGASEHLLGCPTCMFLIRFEDIPNHWKWGE